MDDLIARLENATGPGRELDNDIWSALDQPLPDDPVGCPPRYTASIDAALTLVPKEAIWKLFNDWPGEFHWAEVERSGWLPCNAQNLFRSEACESPAIALCIAALKARGISIRELTDQ